MSAYVVDDKTINRIVGKLHRDNDPYLAREINEITGLDITNRADAEQFGRAILMLNIQAVNERYAEEDDGTKQLERYRFQTSCPERVQAFKSLRCLIYQCSEGVVPDTPLYKLLESISHSWSYAIVRALPSFDNADWG